MVRLSMASTSASVTSRRSFTSMAFKLGVHLAQNVASVVVARLHGRLDLVLQLLVFHERPFSEMIGPIIARPAASMAFSAPLNWGHHSGWEG